MLLRITFTRCQPSSHPVRRTLDFKKLIALLGGLHSFFMVSTQYAVRSTRATGPSLRRSLQSMIIGTIVREALRCPSMHRACMLHARCMLVAGACKMEAIALQKGSVSDHKPGAGKALKAPCATAKGSQLRNSLGINYPQYKLTVYNPHEKTPSIISKSGYRDFRNAENSDLTLPSRQNQTPIPDIS